MSSETIGGSKTCRFYDISRVRDFIINDYITFYYVRQYCGFLIENEEQMVVPYHESHYLRQLDLEYIYCAVKDFQKY